MANKCVHYELFKGCSRVNTHKYFFLNRVAEIWNALPSTMVAASSSNVFKRMLDCVDLAKLSRPIVIFYFSSYFALFYCMFYMCIRASVCGLPDPSCPAVSCNH